MKIRANDTDRAETGDLPPEIHLPGLGELREVVTNYRPPWISSGATLRKDSVAGLTVAVASVPEGMAVAPRTNDAVHVDVHVLHVVVLSKRGRTRTCTASRGPPI